MCVSGNYETLLLCMLLGCILFLLLFNRFSFKEGYIFSKFAFPREYSKKMRIFNRKAVQTRLLELYSERYNHFCFTYVYKYG